MEDVTVIGSGPAGLSTGAELVARGIGVTVLEHGPRPAAAWAARYEGLRFNTSRWWSALPGAPFPQEYGWFPTRDQYVDYLDDYQARHHVPVRTGVTVHRLDPDGDSGWRVDTDTDTVHSAHVVVATGIYNVPRLPDWAVENDFLGTVRHSRDYRNAEVYRGRRVLVVGAGSTGLEIAHELADCGAAEVLLSVRTPPTILLRSSGGLPGDLPVPLFLKLPPRVVDRIVARIQKLTVGDLSELGLGEPPAGAFTQLLERGAGTAIVDAEVIEALRAGAVRVVPAVGRLTRTGALLADGSHVDVDDVIAATGYTTGLRELVGHLDGVVDHRDMPFVDDGGEARPGLRFVGYVFRPGITGYAGRIARRAAREIADAMTRQPA
ncbi:MAG: NAD(P)/FAD-dependent oxidoreductase [Dermatophilaceae bacterium]